VKTPRARRWRVDDDVGRADLAFDHAERDRPHRRRGVAGKARAPVSRHNAPSFSIFRAASATRMPAWRTAAPASTQASPAPTISAILYFGISMRVSLGLSRRAAEAA